MRELSIATGEVQGKQMLPRMALYRACRGGSEPVAAEVRNHRGQQAYDRYATR